MIAQYNYLSLLIFENTEVLHEVFSPFFYPDPVMSDGAQI